jgi:ComF family protein
MATAGREFWPAGPALVPVPLHRGRQLRRKYNQSFELAAVTARLAGLGLEPGIVARRRPTRQQVGLSGQARRRNVAGAFAVSHDALERLAGRPVVIIDDVYTTGSTVKAVTRALRRAGVEKIDVLTFARVVIGSEDPI